jgi:hypothetical protein
MAADGSRPDWYWTGRRPEPGAPGIQPDGSITALPLPRLNDCTRQAALDYFDNAWLLTEVLLSALQGEEAFYRPPAHNLRHPMIFYYAHPATLYVNKLRVAGLLSDPVNAYFEHIFETGVDEMSWDDLSKNAMIWPSVRPASLFHPPFRQKWVAVVHSYADVMAKRRYSLYGSLSCHAGCTDAPSSRQHMHGHQLQVVNHSVKNAMIWPSLRPASCCSQAS